MGKKKSLFTKKNSQKFQVVLRSQNDPKSHDENSTDKPQQVLKPIGIDDHKQKVFFFADY